MDYDKDKCKNCSRRDLCKDGLVECVIPYELDITTEMDPKPVKLKPKK